MEKKIISISLNNYVDWSHSTIDEIRKQLNELEQLGAILKKARMKKGYSTRKLAELSESASNAEISMLENAKRLKPDPIMLKSTAKILDLDYIELFQVHI